MTLTEEVPTVAVAGLNVHEAYAGRFEQLKLRVPVNPLWGVAARPKVAVAPVLTVWITPPAVPAVI